MNLDKSDLVDFLKTKALPVVAILAVVVIFFVMISDANKPKTPPTATPAAAPDPAKDRGQQSARMQEIIKRSDGNWDHLSPDDQGVLNGVTGGHGKDALRMMGRHGKNGPVKAEHSPAKH